MAATADVKLSGGGQSASRARCRRCPGASFRRHAPRAAGPYDRDLKILAAAAGRLGLPVLLTEQYRKGLGRTLPELRGLLDGVEPVEKTAFSCGGVPGFIERLQALDAGPVVLAEVETHGCAALDLIAARFSVSIVADAVCSRRRESLDLGLAQARQAGVIVTSTETLVFQWPGGSDTAFREMAKALKE